MRRGGWQIYRQLYSVILVLVLWEVAGRLLAKPLFLPPFSSVMATFYRLLMTGELGTHVGISTARSLSGFALSALVGIPLGLLMGWYRLWEDFWTALVSLVYPIPKVGLIPLFILWLGIGDASKIAVIFSAAVFPLIINTYTGVKGVPRLLIWSALTFGANQREVLWKVVFPASLPHIFSGLRLAMGISWILLFAAEMIAAHTGLGHLILVAERMLDTDVVFAALILIAILGFLFDRMLLLLGGRLCDWYFQESTGF